MEEGIWEGRSGAYFMSFKTGWKGRVLTSGTQVPLSKVGIEMVGMC